MYRLSLLLAAVGAILFCAAGYGLAQAGSEYQLPPVKLKPERPITTQPIPPTPAPAELAPEEVTPAPVPTVEPAPAPKPPAPVAAPAPAPEPIEAPPAVEPPSEILWQTPEPAAPTPAPAPAAEPAPAPAIAPAPKPAKAPVAVETPPELPPLPPVPPELAGEKPEELPPVAVPQKMRKPEEIQKEAVEAQIAPAGEAEPALGGNEVGLVEEVARSRKAYTRALTALKDFYLARANATKLDWINSELAAFERVPKIQYLGVAELASPNLRPVRRIEAADQLYAEGIKFKDYPALPPGKKDYLKIALQKFQTIIEKYPDSDKIDDAAFRMGETYSGWYFQDYTRAVQCYERCWQWNPRTDHPALFNAAKIYDEKLKNRAKAVELYNRVLTESANENLKNQAMSRLNALTGK